MLGVGDRAPEFVLGDMTVTADRAVLLAFFKVSCPVCQLTLPYLARMAGGEVAMVAISQDGPAATEEFRRDFGVTFTTVLDEADAGYPMSNAYGITHVPTMFLVEPGGEISMAISGFSKMDLEAVGARAGMAPFRAGEDVPAWKAG